MFLQVEYVGPSQNLTSGWAYAGYTSKHNQTYMAGGRREENLCYAAKYDPQTDAWINLPKLPRLVLPATDKNGKTCVFMSGTKLYSIHDSKNTLTYKRSFHIFTLDDGSNVWTHARSTYYYDDISCANINESTVALIGEVQSYFYRFYSHILAHQNWRPSLQRWNVNHFAFIHKKGSKYCTVSDNYRYAYILGGSLLASVERYDTVKYKWELLAPMPKELSGHACLFVDETIIVTHGTAIYLYNVGADIWRISSTKLKQFTEHHSMGLVLP